jgi:hypothetical protein
VPGATSPEELDTLLEDLLLADPGSVAELFEHGAALVAGSGVHRRAVAAALGGHLAGGLPVPVDRDLCVVVGRCSVTVCRRQQGTGWRIAVLVTTHVDQPGSRPPPD